MQLYLEHKKGNKGEDDHWEEDYIRECYPNGRWVLQTNNVYKTNL